MKFLGSFFNFSSKVLDAAKKGGLPSTDLKKLDRLLTRTGKKNTIFAKGLLSALSAGGASPEDVKRFGALLQKSEERMMNDKNKALFTDSEMKTITEIFQRAYLSSKTARWFSAQLDELLAEEISEFISGSKRIEIGLPSKKSIKIDIEPRDNKKLKA